MDTAADAGTRKRHPMPFTRIEIAVLGLVDGKLSVLLGRRAGEPHKGRWALPGGVLRIDGDPSLDAAAQRVAQERLQTQLPAMTQVCAVGGPHRDPDRADWALSVVYRALVWPAEFRPSAGKRIEALEWRPVEQAMDDRRMAFDHADLVARAVAITRAEVRDMALPASLFPPTFTLGELQAMCQAVLGPEAKLDKSSFRRRLTGRHGNRDLDLVEPVEGEVRTGPNRPAQVYRLRIGRHAAG
jgi:ADP-ribose pyrophosphatase YjhB (NUDIX family)